MPSTRDCRHSLAQFADSLVQVVISEIVHREMKRHLTESIGKARAALEKGIKEVQQEMQASDCAAIRARKSILTGESDAEIAQRLPQREHRSGFTASASNASHPAITASVRGCAVRVWPQSHLSISTYWPK